MGVRFANPRVATGTMDVSIQVVGGLGPVLLACFPISQVQHSNLGGNSGRLGFAVCTVGNSLLTGPCFSVSPNPFSVEQSERCFHRCKRAGAAAPSFPCRQGSSVCQPAQPHL